MATTTGKVITCKAMVQWGLGSELVEETIQVAPPKKGEVRVKVLASGVCHTDYSEPRSFPSPQLVREDHKTGEPFEQGRGVILGHEGGVIVESVGEGVTDFAPGDYAIPLYISECRQCKNCTIGAGRTNLCSATDETQYLGYLLDGTSRFSCVKNGKTVELLHFMGCSTFAEYTVIPSISLAKISKKAPLEQVCLLGCGVTTGYGAVLNTMKVEPNSTAAVFGIGGVGLSVIMGLRQVGAKRIIAVDLNPAKESLARAFGATDFIDCSSLKEGDTPEGQVWERNGWGVDYTFECVGQPTLMRGAIECLQEGWGKCCIIGVAPKGKKLEITPNQLVQGKSVTGTAFGGCRGKTQLPVYVENFLAGKAPFVDKFVSAVVPHTEVNEAFHKMHERGSTILRSVITFPHEGDAEVAEHRRLHNQKKSAIVFMHGLGDKPSSWQESIEYLCNKIGPNSKAVCPAAPIQAITKNKGEKMTAWFDVFAEWPRTPESKDDIKGIVASASNIHFVLDQLINQEGIPSERIIVGGFSQGAVLAAQTVYSFNKKLAGAVCLSGWVPDAQNFVINPANATTPCFFGHGTADEIVAISNQDVGSKALAAKSVPVVVKKYDKLGHDSNEAEFDDILAFLKERLL